MSTELRNDCELAQRFCDDVVLVAGVFRPNAPGRSELSGFRALSRRQLLKAHGAYFTERMLIAVTPLEVVAIALGPAAVIHPRRILWNRARLDARRIPSFAERPGATGVALSLASIAGYPRLEVARQTDDQASWDVIERLTRDEPGPGGTSSKSWAS